MSDNDDTHSEVAPDGWGDMYNNLLGGGTSPTLPKDSAKRSTGAADTSGSQGWFGGWFGGSSKPKVEEEEHSDSDESGVKSSNHSFEDSENESPANASSSQNSSGRNPDDTLSLSMDSDGFPLEKDPVANLLKASPSESIASTTRRDSTAITQPSALILGDLGAQPAGSPSRRDRIRNRQLFVAPATAAEVAIPDAPQTAGLSEDTATGGFWTNIFGGATTTTTTTAQAVDPTPPQEAEEETQTVEIKPRELLPDIPNPPVYHLPRACDSFFPVDYSHAPRNEMHTVFQGRLRGWPRQLAPYWSSQGAAPPEMVVPFKSNTSNTLYMFRVT